MSTTLRDIKSQDFKGFFRILGEIEGIPGLVKMMERDGAGAVDFRGERDPVPSEEFGEVTELPYGLGWYQGICDKVRYPRLILTPKGWTLLQNEDKRVRELAKLGVG